LIEAEVLREKVHEANISVHRVEAAYYDLFHPEVYSKQEQKRITSILNSVDKLIEDNHKKALDFGSGTGNLTDKLLKLGYAVTAVDISTEMSRILRLKYKKQIKSHKLAVINSPIEFVQFKEEEFDLITCYSVLHHLPNYEEELRRLCGFLKKGGVMYLDHEASPFRWKTEPAIFSEAFKTVYLHSNPMLNSAYFQLVGFNAPNVDYSLSDYWYKKEHPLDHQKIQQIFKEEKFESYTRTDYHLKASWIFNPIFPVYEHVCKPEVSCWIAKK
jgi:ubiquinone/menaquinone biosynthesis C-methylase UbiE